MFGRIKKRTKTSEIKWGSKAGRIGHYVKKTGRGMKKAKEGYDEFQEERREKAHQKRLREMPRLKSEATYERRKAQIRKAKRARGASPMRQFLGGVPESDELGLYRKKRTRRKRKRDPFDFTL